MIAVKKRNWLPQYTARLFLLGMFFLSVPRYFHSNDTINSQQSPGRSVTSEIRTLPLILLPDSEVIYSPASLGFNTIAFIQKANGYLSTHEEYLRSTGWTSAAEIIERVALENSINPKLLIALMEYRCTCVYGSLPKKVNPDYLMGVEEPMRKGLYHQLGWVANQISIGYYGWRRESSLQMDFPDGETISLDPPTNAGSAGIAFLLSKWFDQADWQQAVNLGQGFPALYTSMYGDSWDQVASEDNLDLFNLRQPKMILPFQPGKIWAFTSGPHKAWETEGALAALDFAPKSEKEGCTLSNEWVVAVANGVVARSENGAVVLDLDGDSHEQTGWAILYMHVAARDRVPLGKYLHTGDLIGHPSCEGARASGTHIHIARKFNGEWIDAGGDCPFVLDGWLTHAGEEPYSGTLTQNGHVIVANLFAPRESLITRPSIKDILLWSYLQHMPREN